MAEELSVVLNRSDNAAGFGFSLLGKPGLPPIIYNILEDSPAAESGEVEVGDVILKVNETDVNRFSTKEVLKCLRLSEDPVTLKIKRDPKIKATVQKLGGSPPPPTHYAHHPPPAYHHQHHPHLHYHHHGTGAFEPSSLEPVAEMPPASSATVPTPHSRLQLHSSTGSEIGSGDGDTVDCATCVVLHNHSNSSAAATSPTSSSSSSASSPPHSNNSNPSSNNHHHHRRSPESRQHCNNGSSAGGGATIGLASAANGTAAEPLGSATTLGYQDRLQWEPLGGGGGGGGAEKPKFEAFMMTGEHILKISNTQQASVLPKQQKKSENLRYHNSHVHHLRHQPYQQQHNQHNQQYHQQPVPPPPPHQHNSVPNSPNEMDLGHHNHHHNHHRDRAGGGPGHRSGPNSVNTSPVSVKRDQNDGPTSGTVGALDKTATAFSSNFVRTSRSEDQLQDTQSISAVDIDMEEDLTSSLNTLLDTRPDGSTSNVSSAGGNSSDRIVWTYNAPVSSSVEHHQHHHQHQHLHHHPHQSQPPPQQQQQQHSPPQQGHPLVSPPQQQQESSSSSPPKLCHTLSNGSSSTTSSSTNGGGGASTGATAGSTTPAVPPTSLPHSNNNNNSSGNENNGTASPSPSNSLRSTSPASPTSVSSSIMSSHSGSRRVNGSHPISDNGTGIATAGSTHHYTSGSIMSQSQNGGGSSGGTAGTGGGAPCTGAGGGDLSVSEAISNISSPDYHDDDNSSMMGMRDCMMEISDHSDSDSTLLVSEPRQHHHRTSGGGGSATAAAAAADKEKDCKEHRIVIQVKGPAADKLASASRADSARSLRSSRDQMSAESYDFDENDQDSDETVLRDGGRSGGGGNSSPPVSEDGDSDIDSLHSFHYYSPKAVDMPSAVRLAKRLYTLDGFKKSDVSRHLSKANEFSRAVAEEYLRYFDFEQDTLDLALRKFLKQFSLTGETQERERVLVHFSKRFLDCNPGSFNSQDAAHTLTCAIMLLNTDLHGQTQNRKMACNEFIENLAGLNESENFPREVLKQLYHAIKNYPLEWAVDDDCDEMGGASNAGNQHHKAVDLSTFSGNPFLDVPNLSTSTEHKKGYVMRKCCYETNAKRTPFHKRSWKMFYCTLRDMVLYLHKDENGFRKNQMGGDSLHNAVRVHHALATKASDYTKKQYVFRLQTADQAEYLFQTSDSKELQSWIDTINFVCARFSSSPLEAGVGSHKKFQRPLLPCTHTKLTMREQLRDHEERVIRLENELKEHHRAPPDRGAKALVIQNYKEKDVYLNFELKRYKCYAYILRQRLSNPYAGDPLSSLAAGGNPGSGNIIMGGPGPIIMTSGGGIIGPAGMMMGGGSLVESCIGEIDEATSVHIPLIPMMETTTVADGAAGVLVPPPVPERRTASPPITAANNSSSAPAAVTVAPSTNRKLPE